MKGISLANNNDKERRVLDHYPTPPDVTVALMDFLKLKPCRIWEPACGDGFMSNVLKSYGHTVIETDIRETTVCKKPINFLHANINCDAIITNPPFNLSEEFIIHALNHAPVVAMLFKSQYWHAKKRTSLFNQHTPAYILPLTWRPDFLFDTRQVGGKKSAPTMEVCWTVWITGNNNAQYKLLKK
jgi:hypothetical protein